VSERISIRARQLAFFCVHQHRIQRPLLEPAQATLPRLRRYWNWKRLQTEAEKAEVTEPSPMLKESTTSKTLDELDHYLLIKRGVNGTPLAYLVRMDVDPDEDERPGFGMPNITDELIARARHGTYHAYDVQVFMECH
jgi:hypothetical protein